MRRVFSCAAALVLVAMAHEVRADWGAFYLGSTPDAPRDQRAALSDRTGMHPQNRTWNRPRSMPMDKPDDPAGPGLSHFTATDNRARCVAEILRAQDRYEIPDNILLGIGLQEAGVSRDGGLTVWPWAVNAAGEGRIFDNQTKAIAWVRERQATGVRSIDVGCMQINLHWHPDAFTDLEQGFDPVMNVDYAARFLQSLHRETGDWMRAAGAYHSRTPERADVYLAALRRNVAVANDRIAAFRGMVEAKSFDAVPGVFRRSEASTQDIPQTVAADPVAPWDHGHWSTRAEDAGGVYGIYSRAQLTPVLPHFVQDF